MSPSTCAGPRRISASGSVRSFRRRTNTSCGVPPGFGHGFLVLSDTAGFEYNCTDYYAPEFERSIRWDDPDIGIDWPLAEGVQPLLIDRDATAPLLKDADTFS